MKSEDPNLRIWNVYGTGGLEARGVRNGSVGPCGSTYNLYEICHTLRLKEKKKKKSCKCKDMRVSIKHSACSDGISKTILT